LVPEFKIAAAQAVIDAVEGGESASVRMRTRG